MIGENILFPYGVFTLFIAALPLAAVFDVKTRQIPNTAPLLPLAAGLLNLFDRGPFRTSYVFRAARTVSRGFPPADYRYPARNHRGRRREARGKRRFRARLAREAIWP